MKPRTLIPLVLGLGWLVACGGGASGATSTSGVTSSGSGGAGTGGAGGASASAIGGSGGQAAFALTSTGFAQGAAIPAKYTCKGANASPDLTWTAGPSGTKSYAVVFTDKSINLIHWVIWNIPASVTSLPEGVQKVEGPPAPAGAKQVKSYDNQTFGYMGPCPPNSHDYEFAVHALDVATLPNVTTASTRQAVAGEIMNHDLAHATLGGSFSP